MAYTQPVEAYKYLAPGTAVQILDGVSETGAQTPFALLPISGRYWGQTTFQVVLIDTVSALSVSLEIDLTGVDANFVTLFSAVDLVANKSLIYTLSGGNARYRWNVATITGGGSFDMWAISG